MIPATVQNPMDIVESTEQTGEELIRHAQDIGIDLTAFYASGLFNNGARWIYLWRTESGQIKYNMQGRVETLPGAFASSASAFTGWWNEAGAFGEIGEALEFVIAWIGHSVEVDDLPIPWRERKRWGIG